MMSMRENTVRYAIEWRSETADLPRGALGDTMKNIRSEMFRRFHGRDGLVLTDMS